MIGAYLRNLQGRLMADAAGLRGRPLNLCSVDVWDGSTETLQAFKRSPRATPAILLSLVGFDVTPASLGLRQYGDLSLTAQPTNDIQIRPRVRLAATVAVARSAAPARAALCLDFVHPLLTLLVRDAWQIEGVQPLTSKELAERGVTALAVVGVRTMEPAPAPADRGVPDWVGAAWPLVDEQVVWERGGS